MKTKSLKTRDGMNSFRSPDSGSSLTMTLSHDYGSIPETSFASDQTGNGRLKDRRESAGAEDEACHAKNWQ